MYISYVADIEEKTISSLSQSKTLEHAVDEILELWMENGGDDYPVYIVIDRWGTTEAIVTRDRYDSEIAHVFYPNLDKSESYLCRFKKYKRISVSLKKEDDGRD